MSGSVSSSYTKNPTNPKYRNDSAVKKLPDDLASFGRGR